MKYVLCFTVIMRDRRLSLMAKATYAYLKSYTSTKDNSCWPAIATIAKDLGKGPRAVRYALAELARWQIISWNSGYTGKSNTYFLQDGKAALYMEQHPYPELPPHPYPKVPPSHTHKEAHVCEESESYGEKQA